MQVATVKPILDFNIGGLFDKELCPTLGYKRNFSSSIFLKHTKLQKSVEHFPIK